MRPSNQVGIIDGYNQAAGPYRVPHCQIESTFVYTNTIPCGFMRAPGEPQAVFALESHIDEIARQLDIDPLEFRLQEPHRRGRRDGLW